MANELTGVTEIDAVSSTIIESMVQDYLQEGLIITPTLKPVVAPKGAKAVNLPRLGGFTVADKLEGVAVEAQALLWAADSLPLTQRKTIHVHVEEIAEIQSQPNLMAALAERMGADMANAIDAFVYSELVQASASNPDHRLAFADTSLKAADILSARALLNKEKIPMVGRYIVINPDDEKSILGVDNFVRAESYGSAVIPNGEIGRIFGFTVIMSNNATYPIAYHSSAVGVGMQQMPTYTEQFDLEYEATRAALRCLFGAKVLDSGKRCVKLGSAS